LQHVVGSDRMDACRSTSLLAVPFDTTFIAPERHDEALEIPQDWSHWQPKTMSNLS
jgi:hypothetical protein